MTRTLATVLVVLLVAIAGCAGSPASDSNGDDPSDTPVPTNTDGTTATPTPEPDDSSSGATEGSVDFYVSDEPNAIGDFAHLNVTITKVGFARSKDDSGNDSGGWVEYPAGNRTVDLTRLVGANATLIGSFDVPEGKYTKVFAYVSEVNGTLTNGESVRVKLPSEKLQLNEPFAVESNSSVQFVFDIAVHEAGKSGKYVLKPVIGESGTDVPIEDVDGEKKDGEKEEEEDGNEDEQDDERNETDETSLNATFLGNVTAGENATLQVTENGSAVENATVFVDGEAVGTTDADGKLMFTVPDGEKFDVKVQAGEAEVELEVTFEDDS